MSKHCSDSHNNHLHKSSRSSSQGHGWSSRNDVIYFSSLTADHSLSFFFPCISSFICILGPSFPSGHDSIKIAGGWSSGGHAGGYAVETRLYDSDQIGLGGGESRRYLFESLHSVWWCPHGCGACYPWIKTQLRRGYVALFKPANVYAWMGSVHPPIWPRRWGKTRYLFMYTSYEPTINASDINSLIKKDTKISLLRLRKSTQKTFKLKKICWFLWRPRANVFRTRFISVSLH